MSSEKNKKSFIDYTSRDFDDIKEDLKNYIKRYYPNTYKDFNEASFGMMMLDSVAYIGDILSFYLDYSVNESFIDTAIEYENVLDLAKQNGFDFDPNPTAIGTVSLYILVPTNAVGGGPDEDYLPILRRGTEFSTQSGNKFVLSEDVDFSIENEVVAGNADEQTGRTVDYIVKKKAKVISGEITQESISVGSFERFKRIELSGDKIAEIISVKDADGHRYHEVPALSQNYVFKSLLNSGNAQVPNKIEKVVVPRRFVMEKTRDKTFLQFGFGAEVDEGPAKPDEVAIDKVGRDFVSDSSFDPTRALKSNTLGISPANTTLTVRYRKNSTENVNASVGEVTNVDLPIFKFDTPTSLNASDKRTVTDSLRVDNEEPITGDVSFPNVEEIKRRSKTFYSSQDRAVTAEDYRSLIYSMPTQFGAVKRVNVVPDRDALKRNMNVYLIAEDSQGELVAANDDLKENIRRWISTKKPVNDTVDMHDAFIVNLAIDYVIVAEEDRDKFDVLQRANRALRKKLSVHFDIGEDFSITEIYNDLNEVDGVADAVDVRITRKTGPNYSDVRYDVEKNKTGDGRLIHAPKNVVFEILRPDEDIKGSIK